MKHYLRSIITSALKQFDLSEDETPDIQVEKPNQPEHGDSASNIALNLAGILQMTPRSVAEKIVWNLEYDPRKIEAVEIAGPGFINFRYADSYLYNELQQILDQGEHFGKIETLAGKRILIEFVSANPTGPLTVGHGRNAVLGDTIARLLEWNGAEVDREYYFNNAGRQMRMLAESVRARYLQELGEDLSLPEGGYEGAYIRDIARALAEEYGESLVGSDDLSVFREKAEQLIFEEIQSTLERMHIKIDSFFNEQEVYDNGAIDRTVETFRKKDLAYDRDGATWFRTSRFGKDKDTVLIK
ncbi:MAG TPA: arginine--tRNA ligase, partial [Fodinibius sp.]|nr:arginine--tRNA ligase [Fodinibius sp.]